MYSKEFSDYMDYYFNTPHFKEIILQMNFSLREQDIVKLILKGLPNQQISEQLFIEPKTVKFHITNILKKFSHILNIKKEDYQVRKMHLMVYFFTYERVKEFTKHLELEKKLKDRPVNYLPNKDEFNKFKEPV